ncbi:MAG: aspartate carbamoyltransferase [Candidatus Diapherotrites archaeon]
MKISHVLSTKQFSDPEILSRLFDLAWEMEKNVKNDKLFPSLSTKVLAALFYEPSTRTRFSFESAMHRLGGRVISTEAASIFSSVTKGETLEDTIRIISGYADVIVLRHPEMGAAQRASVVSSVPVINAGDGMGEHPTQALLDMYTIWREKKRLENLNVILMGDLRYGRTIHSLVYLLAQQKGIKLNFVSPIELRIPDSYRLFLNEKNIPFQENEKLEEKLDGIDVLYMTRVQKERFASMEEYAKVKDSCIISKDVLSRLPMDAIIMHPLPRINEIAVEVDQDPRAAYFRQATNGLYVRMALLELLFERKTLEQEALK